MRIAHLVAAGVMAASVTAAQGQLITLFEDDAENDFGTNSPGLVSDPVYSGESALQLTYLSGFAASNWNLNDGQASIADVTSYPISLWYNTEVSGNVQLHLRAWTGASVQQLTNDVIVSLNGNGEWNNLLIEFDMHESVAGADHDQLRGIRMNFRNWMEMDEGTTRTITWDLVQVAVPEPTSLALLGLGGMTMLRRRR